MRLDEPTNAHQKAIETLAATFEAKLGITGVAFEDCDRRIKELQQAAYAVQQRAFRFLQG